MNISAAGLQLIQSFEGFKDKAYQDSACIWTIGYGTIKYPTGNKVQENDTCNELQAEQWLLNDVANTVKGINNLIFGETLNQNQFDSLVSFAYNVGLGALKGSTLYKKAIVNPNDESIYKYDPNEPAYTCEFTKWINAGGKQVQGLLNRRMQEADLYGTNSYL